MSSPRPHRPCRRGHRASPSSAGAACAAWRRPAVTHVLALDIRPRAGTRRQGRVRQDRPDAAHRRRRARGPARSPPRRYVRPRRVPLAPRPTPPSGRTSSRRRHDARAQRVRRRRAAALRHDLDDAGLRRPREEPNFLTEESELRGHRDSRSSTTRSAPSARSSGFAREHPKVEVAIFDSRRSSTDDLATCTRGSSRGRSRP